MTEKASSTSIRESILHPGRSREYIKKEFGSKAFEKGPRGREGKVKMEYWPKAKAKAKASGNLSLYRAINEGEILAKKAMERARG